MFNVRLIVNIVLDKLNVLNAVKVSGFQELHKVQQVHVRLVIPLVKPVRVDQEFVPHVPTNIDLKVLIVFQFITLPLMLNST